MRIRRLPVPTQSSWEPHVRRWARSRKRIVQFLITVALGIALATVFGLWYNLEGYKVINPLFHKWFAQPGVESNDLPTLYVDIDHAAYQALVNRRERALQRGILGLEDAEWLPAEIRFGEDTIPVRIALSDQAPVTDHLQESKWSVRVEISGHATLLGMHSFSMRSPATGRYLDEWLYVEDLRRAGILAPRQAFVNVSVNGDAWGIYALQEGVSFAFLASQDRQEGVIVRMDDSLSGWRSSPDATATGFGLPALVHPDPFGASDVQSDATRRSQGAAALGLLQAFQSRQRVASQVFDAELMGKYIAHANWWGARQGEVWRDEHYYYDPTTARLEPIGYQSLWLEPDSAGLFGLAQYGDVAIMRSYAKEALRISQPGYVEALRAAYADVLEQYRAPLAQEFPLADLEPPWEVLAERQELLWATLHPPQTVHAYLVEGTGIPSALDVWVGNLSRYPVALHQVRIGDLALDVQPDWITAGTDTTLGRGALPLHRDALPSVVLRGAQEPVPQYVVLHIPQVAIEELMAEGTLSYSSTLHMSTSLVGVDTEVVVDVQRSHTPGLAAFPRPVQPSVEEALERYPFLTVADRPGFLALKPGTWHVKGDLVLPHGFGLWATQPTTLTFERQAMLFSTGPLWLRGTDSEGIRLVPQVDSWQGLVVLQAGSERVSLLDNVEIAGTTGVRRDGWGSDGGITFYESPVVLNRCRVLHTTARYAVQVVRARFEFTHSEFGYISSDAFHGVDVQGKVVSCTFHDVLGVAMNVRKSDVHVRNVTLLRVYDKGIVAGQGSLVDARGIRATDIGIPIVSKDMSSVQIRDVYLDRVWTSGFAAYLEEMRYGPSRIRASRVVLKQVPVRAFVQETSIVTINGASVAGSELDITWFDRWQKAFAGVYVLDYRLGPAIRLVGYDLTASELEPGEYLELVLYWQTNSVLHRDYTIFVHVLDASGQVVAQWDTMPRDNAFPTTRWPVGQIVDDPHHVLLPADIPIGEYRIALGMYHWPTGERLAVYGPDGSGIVDAAIILGQKIQAK